MAYFFSRPLPFKHNHKLGYLAESLQGVSQIIYRLKGIVIGLTKLTGPHPSQQHTVRIEVIK
jgi:hypothetical protein